MTRLETERLILRHAHANDALFIVELLNDPGWLRFIGNRGIHTEQQATDYIEGLLLPMYAIHSFGLCVVERQQDHVPMGMCGLLKRDFLEDVDLGFAFLQRYQGQGYAYEAASAVLHHATSALGVSRIAAITTPDNERSARLLEKLGLHFERMIHNPANTALRLFVGML